LKTNKNGQVEWMKSFGDPLHDQGFLEIISSRDGDYLLAGGFSNKDDLFPNDIHGGGGILAKMDEQGNMLWFKKFEDETGDAEYQDIVQLPDRTIITTGYRHVPLESPSLMKFNEAGELIWWRNYDYHPQRDETFFSLTATQDHGFLMTGYAHALIPLPSASMGWVLKVDSMGCEIPMCVVGTEDPFDEQKQDGISIYPNPFQDKIFIKTDDAHIAEAARFTFISTAGATVQSFVEKLTGLNTIETNSLPAGFYFLQIETDTFKFVEKMVKME
jgi:Arc/MetJ family transcription regulator